MLYFNEYFYCEYFSRNKIIFVLVYNKYYKNLIIIYSVIDD